MPKIDIMTLKNTFFACLFLVNSLSFCQQDNEITKLNFMIGQWKSSVTQVLRDGCERLESGHTSISYELDSTYVLVKTELCHESSCRSYLQMIAHNAEEDTFESDYFFSNTPINVFEKGAWDEASKKLTTRGINPWAPDRENGINIISTCIFERKG